MIARAGLIVGNVALWAFGFITVMLRGQWIISAFLLLLAMSATVMISAVIGSSEPEGNWNEVPKWHPMRWLGFDVRARVWDDPHRVSAFWQYDRSKKVARLMLHRLYSDGCECDQCLERLWREFE